MKLVKTLLRHIPTLHGAWKSARALYRREVYRRTLLRAVRLGPVRIVVGSNGVYDPGWHPTEASFLNLLQPNQWDALFPRDSIEAILAEHVWEHLTGEEGLAAARTCHRFLKEGGCVRAAVPDCLHPDPGYRDWARPGGSGPSADDHKLFYSYKTFAQVFERAGFQVKLLEYFDESGRFHATDWDPAGGKIRRSLRFDRRNADGHPHYTSVILDAWKSGSSTRTE
jgi:YD repeat-containing protein